MFLDLSLLRSLVSWPAAFYVAFTSDGLATHLLFAGALDRLELINVLTLMASRKTHL